MTTYTPEHYKAAGEVFFGYGPDAVADEISRLGMSFEDVLASAQAVRPDYTAQDLAAWAMAYDNNPWSEDDVSLDRLYWGFDENDKPSAYIPVGQYSTDTHGAHAVTGADGQSVQLIPGSPGYDAEDANAWHQEIAQTDQQLAAYLNGASSYDALSSSWRNDPNINPNTGLPYKTSASTDRFTPEQYKAAGKVIEQYIDRPDIIAFEIDRIGMTPEEVTKAVQTVRPDYDLSNVTSWFQTQKIDPWAQDRWTDDQYKAAGDVIRQYADQPDVLASEIARLGLTTGEVLKAAQTANPSYTMGDVDRWITPRYVTSGGASGTGTVVSGGTTGTSGGGSVSSTGSTGSSGATGGTGSTSGTGSTGVAGGTGGTGGSGNTGGGYVNVGGSSTQDTRGVQTISGNGPQNFFSFDAPYSSNLIKALRQSTPNAGNMNSGVTTLPNQQSTTGGGSDFGTTPPPDGLSNDVQPISQTPATTTPPDSGGGSGSGGGGDGTQTVMDSGYSNPYFQANPDVAQMYEQNFANSMTPDAYAMEHWLNYGQTEGRDGWLGPQVKPGEVVFGSGNGSIYANQGA